MVQWQDKIFEATPLDTNLWAITEDGETVGTLKDIRRSHSRFWTIEYKGKVYPNQEITFRY